MQTVNSETEVKSLDLSICVHHYTLRAPCPEGQGIPGKCVQYPGLQSGLPVGCLVERGWALQVPRSRTSLRPGRDPKDQLLPRVIWAHRAAAAPQ